MSKKFSKSGLLIMGQVIETELPGTYIVNKTVKPSLPTPIATDGTNGAFDKEFVVNKHGKFPKPGEMLYDRRNGKKVQDTLRQRIRLYGHLPTPVASDATVGAIIGANDTYRLTKGLPRKINGNGKDGSVGLGRIVQLEIEDGNVVLRNDGRKLNPAFVCFLLGFDVEHL